MTTKVHVHEPCRGPPDSRVIRLPEVHHNRHIIMQQISDARSFLPQTGHIVESLAVNCPRCSYSELQRQPQSSTKKLTPSNIKGPILDLARTTEGDQGKTQATSQVLADPGTRALARICCPTKPGNNVPANGQVGLCTAGPYIQPTSVGETPKHLPSKQSMTYALIQTSQQHQASYHHFKA